MEQTFLNGIFEIKITEISQCVAECCKLYETDEKLLCIADE